jgi:hypothetical protein
MPTTTTAIIVVDRNGELRPSEIKEHTPLELAKKCRYKTTAGFALRAEWAYSGSDPEKFIVELWAREDGAAGQENKYEFPPPVDTILFFGACALVAKDMTPHHNIIPLTLEKWDKMYNFLFGGFDTLTNCDDDYDDDEYDELDSIPAHRKTKDGYLKDGFVVDADEEEDDVEEDTDETEYEDETTTTSSDCDDIDDSDDSYDDDNDDDDECNGNGNCNGNDTNINHTSRAIHPTSKKKNAVSKKRGVVAKDDVAIPSFELTEEPYEYEYSDD